MEAFDRDTGENGRVEYSLMETASTKGRFRIHPHSGIIYSQKSLSAGQEFSFSVSVKLHSHSHVQSFIITFNFEYPYSHFNVSANFILFIFLQLWTVSI